MINYLCGQPQIINDKLIIKTSAGIGFHVFVNSTLCNRLTTQNQVELYLHSYIREDRFELYGFDRVEDLALFELLITVSGLGPKTALGMFGENGAQRIIQAVQEAELGFFTNVPRVGKKLGQKIIIDLKTKLGGLKDLDLTPKSQQYQDIKDSLISLGYNEIEIDEVLVTLEIETLTLPTAIKQAIKLLSNK